MPPKRMRRRRRDIVPALAGPDLKTQQKELEAEIYDELVSAGGRPAYPIGLIDDVFRDRETHRAALEPWQDGAEERPDLDKLDVFQIQWKRWRNFCRWQLDNRGLKDDEGGFPAYVEREIRRKRLGKTGPEYAEWRVMVEADSDDFSGGWRRAKEEREQQVLENREVDRVKFAEFDGYARAVRRRLARHGFPARRCRLREDPDQQDKLTTWIEYLNHEYWWLDKYTERLERLRPGYDLACLKLVNSGVLLPGETPEPFCRTAWGSQAVEAIREADKAVKDAMAPAKEVHERTQQDPRRLEITEAERTAMMQVAKERLEKAQKRNSFLHDFAWNTSSYTEAKKNVDRQERLVAWVLAQVPLVEAELARVAEAAHGRRKRKRGPASGDEDDNDDEDGGDGNRWKRVRFQVVPEIITARPRRSARIAARAALN